MARRRSHARARCKCSFCGLKASEVRFLFAGRGGRAHICDVCTLLAVHGLVDKIKPEAG